MTHPFCLFFYFNNTQGESGTSQDHAGRVFAQFRRRAAVARPGGRRRDPRPPVFQIHAASRSLRRGRPPTGPLRPLRAAHFAHLPAGKGRRLPGRIRLGSRMGSHASRSTLHSQSNIKPTDFIYNYK